jgi:SAM-dependent methyltransferase
VSASTLDLKGLGRRLRRLSPWYSWYGWFKVRLDPIYSLVLGELGGDGLSVVDLGSGMGLLEALFLEGRPGACVLAVEHDPRKVSVARRLLDDFPGARVAEGDALTADLGSPDAILLVDLLHYFTVEDQRALLTRCASALRESGVLIVRELDGTAGRGSVTRCLERLAVGLGWNRAPRVHPRPIADLRAQLEADGLTVSVQQAGRGPFSGNALLVARKDR